MSDGPAKPKPHPRSSRLRHRAFIADYHARRLDERDEAHGAGSRNNGQPGDASGVPAAQDDAPTGPRRLLRGKRREYVRDYMVGRHSVLRKKLFAQRRETVIWTSWGLLLGAVNVVIMWYGGYLNIEGRATIGDIMAFQWYTFLLLNPVWQLVNSFSELQRSLAAMERVFEVLAMEDEGTPSRQRHRHPGFSSAVVSQPAGNRAAGCVSLRRIRPRQHRLRPARRDGRGGSVAMTRARQ
ncbi:MAG: ABC transporter ATP-binding protein [Acidobacteria bacterium]|nr:ABC transporter ATP-binding protein [Acidobacteriota bacterium]